MDIFVSFSSPINSPTRNTYFIHIIYIFSCLQFYSCHKNKRAVTFLKYLLGVCFFSPFRAYRIDTYVPVCMYRVNHASFAFKFYASGFAFYIYHIVVNSGINLLNDLHSNQQMLG